MQTPRTTIREDVAALRSAHDESMRSLSERLDGIAERLDQINGNVRRHDTWIAGREPVCAQSLDNLKALSECVKQITTYLDEDRGARKAKSRMASIVNMAVIALTAVASSWASVHVALATVAR